VIDLRELRRLEPWFYRAPSAHNTQPWVLGYERARIELGFDPRRHLEAGDPTRRDLLLSLGAFVEAVLLTAAAEGIPLDFTSEVDVDACRIGAFSEGAHPYETRFRPVDLERRRTSRLAYASGRLSEGALAASRSQLRPGEQLYELRARDIVELFAAGDRWMYETPPVVEELRSWLRLSKRDPRYESDGLAYECLALSRLEAQALGLLLRPRVYRFVPMLGLHRLLTATAKSVLEVDGSVLVLAGAADSPEELLLSGRSLLRVWLELSNADCYTHPLSQIIDCSSTAEELARRLALEPGLRPLSVFRAGRSDPPPPSHRLIALPTVSPRAR
jgi:hypothetical protein